jgi:hypothetical protein
MSTEISACVVFGVKISDDFLWNIEQKRRCSHEFNSRYCPECGQPGELRPHKTPKAWWNQYADTFSVLQIVKCRDGRQEVVIGCVLGRASFNRCQEPVSVIMTVPPYSAEAIAEILGVKPEAVRTYLVMEAT